MREYLQMEMMRCSERKQLGNVCTLTEGKNYTESLHFGASCSASIQR